MLSQDFLEVPSVNNEITYQHVDLIKIVHPDGYTEFYNLYWNVHKVYLVNPVTLNSYDFDLKGIDVYSLFEKMNPVMSKEYIEKLTCTFVS